jgi:nitrite reductase (NADH) large subunit
MVYSDAAAGTYKKLVLKGNKLVGACIYGDTLDGAWYFDLLREGTDISQQRKTILFGQSHMATPATVPPSGSPPCRIRRRSAVATACARAPSSSRHP